METVVGDDKVAKLSLPLSDVFRERNSAHVRKLKRGARRPPELELVWAGARGRGRPGSRYIYSAKGSRSPQLYVYVITG